VLSGRGLCDELITRPEESYRLWCVVVCDLETWMRSHGSLGGCSAERTRTRNLVDNKYVLLCFPPKAFVSDIFFFLWWNFANYLRDPRRNTIGLCAKWSLFLPDFNPPKMDWINKFQVKFSSISFSWKFFLNYSVCDKKPDRQKLYTVLSCLGVFTFCTCCKILICLVCIVARLKLSCV